jgi:hypothetical protein
MPSDDEQGLTPERQRVVLQAVDVATAGDIVPKRWVDLPEFGGKSVCVWGTTRGERTRIISDMRGAGDDTDAAATKHMVATVIECVRDGDGPEAKRIFDRVTHWGVIEKWPSGLIERIVNAVQELDTSGGVTVDELVSFFRVTGTLGDALMSIASACGVSTDCLANSPTGSPLRRLEWLCSQIVSSLSEKTGISATPATSSISADSPA